MLQWVYVYNHSLMLMAMIAASSALSFEINKHADIIPRLDAITCDINIKRNYKYEFYKSNVLFFLSIIVPAIVILYKLWHSGILNIIYIFFAGGIIGDIITRVIIKLLIKINYDGHLGLKLPRLQVIPIDVISKYYFLIVSIDIYLIVTVLET